MPSDIKRFIVFEGGDGAGKSTQARLLAESLRAAGQDVVLSREPGGTENAEKIRTLLFNSDHQDWNPLTEALLMNAARSEHLEKVIRPTLAAGKWVILDRFADSTMAYQGYGQGVDKKLLQSLRQMVVGDTEPGLTLIFDIPAEIALARATDRQRYELFDSRFHETLRLAFLEIAKQNDLYRQIVNASGTLEEIKRDIDKIVSDRFGIKL